MRKSVSDYIHAYMPVDRGEAPQDRPSPQEFKERRERLLQYPHIGIDIYDLGIPVSGDARVHYDMAVLRGFIEPG